MIFVKPQFKDNRSVATWGEFEQGAPEMAARGRDLLAHGDAWDAYLTTLAGEGLPRTHPVNIGIVDGRLLVFVQGHSAKTKDLVADGRYALHAFQDPAAPHEFLVRGRAIQIADREVRDRAAANWPFTPGDDYPLFELDIEHALFRERATPHDWGERYASWRPGG